MHSWVDSIAEYVAGLGLDAAKDHFTEKLEEKKLRDELVSRLSHLLDFHSVIHYSAVFSRGR